MRWAFFLNKGNALSIFLYENEYLSCRVLFYLWNLSDVAFAIYG